MVCLPYHTLYKENVMDSKKAKWEVTGSSLVVTMPDSTVGRYDISRIFPEFEAATAIQQNVIVYGIKQKLSDKTARSEDMKLTGAEAVDTMKTMFEEIVNGTWRAKGVGGLSYKKLDAEAKSKFSPEEYAQYASLMQKLIKQ